METETAREKSESGVPEALTEAEFTSLMRKGLSDPVLARALGRLGLVEVLLQATMMDVARRHGMAMEQKSRADKFESEYNNLKGHLEMYKDQWKRSIQKDGELLHEAFKQWKWKHLNDEVTDVREERDEALAANARMRDYLKRIVEHCSWTREEHDPLVTVGLMANEALKLYDGEDWVSPKDHREALRRMRSQLEMVAINAMSNPSEQVKVVGAMRAIEVAFGGEIPSDRRD